MAQTVSGDSQTRDSFTSRTAFIIACIGSAVGLSGIWLFPYRVSQLGGAAFLIPYLFFVVLLGLTGVVGEMSFGRAMGCGPMGAFGKALELRGVSHATRIGKAIGIVPVLAALGIAIGYTVVLGWFLKYLFAAATGTLLAQPDMGAYFGQITGDFGSIGWHAAALIITLAVMVLGISRGIERLNKIMMPLFFLIFLVLAVRVFFLPGAAEGYQFMFTPRWEALADPMIWIWAMGQAFFSLSVTGSGMIVYGAYLSPQEDVVGVAQHTALFDTIAAVVAALVIIPACFSYGLDVGAGPSLLFVTLPTILQDIPLGQLFAVILYIAMIFAGVSSLQNMFEAVAESLQNRFPRLSRTATLIILAVLCLGFGIGMETISQWGPWMDLVSIYIIPIGATLGAVSWFYVMKKDELLSAINTGSGKTRGRLWYGIGRYLYVPLAVILCCVALFMKVAF